jgi:hypothetical protein
LLPSAQVFRVVLIEKRGVVLPGPKLFAGSTRSAEKEAWSVRFRGC